MRYEGLTEDVKAIEAEVLKNKNLVSHRKPNYMNLFGVENVVGANVYDMSLGGASIHLRFYYDGRNGHSHLDVRDKDIGWLWRASPNILKLLAKLDEMREIRICKACGSNDIVNKGDNLWWCNKCRLPTPGIKTKWTSLKKLIDEEDNAKS